MEFHPLQNQTVPAAADASSSSSSSSNDAVKEYPPPTGHPHTLPHKRTYPLSFLSAEQVKSFDENGFLVVRAADIWTNDEMKLMFASVNQMDDWPDAPGKWMKYYEKKRVNNVPTDEKILCRVENFTQYSPGLDFVLTGHKLMSIMSELFGEQAILYKEKINYKLPGADGFAPHQDVAAGWWMYGQGLHISTLICIDEATEENGCLELSKGAEHRKGMLSDPWKEIPADVVKKLSWESAPTKPGDVIFFDSFVPHKSAPNNSNKPRRVLYATYAKASEGDFRDRYYADKRKSYPPDCERDPSKVYAYKI